ncbi:MAG: hypothetical protein IT204_13705 [Fimbriimonadaceae bacterium]|nr:hypothetical protein [Fimbriimonadaceae bacterium]
MKRGNWFGLAAVLVATLPSYAGGCGGCQSEPVKEVQACPGGGCADGALSACSLKDLESKRVALRWQLHELTYSDTASEADRDAVRSQLANVGGALKVRLAARVTAGNAVAALSADKLAKAGPVLAAAPLQ